MDTGERLGLEVLQAPQDYQSDTSCREEFEPTFRGHQEMKIASVVISDGRRRYPP